MQSIRSRSKYLGRLILTFAVALAVFAAVFVAACTDDQEQPATEEPQTHGYFRRRGFKPRTNARGAESDTHTRQHGC